MTDSPSDTPTDDDALDPAATDAAADDGAADASTDDAAADASEDAADAASGSDADEQAETEDGPADESADDAFAAEIAAAVGASSWSADHGNVKMKITAEQWIPALQTLRDRGMTFFGFLSAIDWAKDVTVGDPVADPDALEERIEVLCRVSTVTDNSAVTLSTDLPNESPSLPTAIGVYRGAEWHERDAFEMFGIHFEGHPRLVNPYLPDAFIGHPLLKYYPLLSR